MLCTWFGNEIVKKSESGAYFDNVAITNKHVSWLDVPGLTHYIRLDRKTATLCLQGHHDLPGPASSKHISKFSQTLSIERQEELVV